MPAPRRTVPRGRRFPARPVGSAAGRSGRVAPVRRPAGEVLLASLNVPVTGEALHFVRVMGVPAARVALSSGRVAAADFASFHTLSTISAPAARAWVRNTAVPLSRAVRMQQWGVRASRVAAWVSADPVRRPGDVYSMLAAAVVVGHSTPDDLNAWLEVATAHGCPFTAGDAFLGPEVVRLAAAGVSPAEARSFLSVPPARRDWGPIDLIAGLS